MNTTENSVRDEKLKITDEQIGKLQRKTNEIIRRVNEGTISYNDALTGMQDIIEGKSKRLRLDSIPQKKWWEENGVIYFKVTSDGATGEQWIERLRSQGFKVNSRAKESLLSKDFKPTKGVIYTIAVLKFDLFIDSNNIFDDVYREANKRNLLTANPEIACLIREKFSNEEIKAIGISLIVTMHKQIKDSYDFFSLLSVNDDGELFNQYVRLANELNFGCSFAFEVCHQLIFDFNS